MCFRYAVVVAPVVVLKVSIDPRGRHSTNVAALSPYCHDRGPIIVSEARASYNRLVSCLFYGTKQYTVYETVHIAKS